VSSTNDSASVLATMSPAAEASCYTGARERKCAQSRSVPGVFSRMVSGNFPPARFPSTMEQQLHFVFSTPYGMVDMEA
jgi:hypothetical protein